MFLLREIEWRNKSALDGLETDRSLRKVTTRQVIQYPVCYIDFLVGFIFFILFVRGFYYLFFLLLLLLFSPYFPGVIFRNEAE